MKGDLSRNSFDRAQHYSAVRLQQGRIVTDADWNEQADLTRYRAERVARDTIGACGAPMDAAGYALVAETNALAVHAVNANVAWIAAEDGVLLLTTNGGADWTPVDLQTSANLRAMQQVGGIGWAVGDGGVVRKTVNHGASWVAQNAGTLNALRGVSVFDADHAWAVGDGGIVIATIDGGANWSLVQTDAARLYAVHFVDDFNGIAAGQGGVIVTSTDGGQTWTVATSGTTSHLRALAVFGTTLAWAAGQGGVIVRSEDAGATWLPCNTPSRANLYAIGFRDNLEGWAAGDGGVLLHSTDGGANWALEDAGTTATLRSLSFFGSDPGWLVGDASTALRIGGGSPDVADVVLPAVNLSIEPGRCYVNGILCELEARASYAHQPDGGAAERLAPGGWLLYLDAWQRHVSMLEAPAIREVALGGPDTATRACTIAQVRALRLPAASPFDWNCGSTIVAWDALVNAPRPLLAARAEPQLAAANICEIAATAGYRRLENQLYRVEIHDGGAAPTFKWSRENGSVAYAVVSVSINAAQQQATVRLAARGKDANLDLAVHDRVELLDDDADLVNRAGVFFEYLNDGNDELELVLAGVPTGTIGQDPSRHPILRRWDHQPDVAGTNVLPVVEGGWIDLEDGVQVRFEPGGVYRPGDYWQIPARTITADVEWPVNDDGDPIAEPPTGIVDAYCRLGIVEVADDGAVTVVSDCRDLFPPLTEMEQLLYVSGDGQDAASNALLPQPLAVRVARGSVPIAGRGVRFAVESGGGTLDAGGWQVETVTDVDGQALCDWTLGLAALAPGRFQRVRASLLDANGQALPGQFVVFCATATLTLQYVSGDGQEAAPGALLAHPLEVRVVNGADGIAGVVLQATIEQGGGSVVGSTILASDPQGQAAVNWRLGSSGSQRLRIDMLDSQGTVVQRLSFNASAVVPASGGGCDITVGKGGQFDELSADLIAKLMKDNGGVLCVCLLPGLHNLSPMTSDGSGQFRLSLHGCGHATLVNLRGPLTMQAYASLEIRDLVIQAEGETGIVLQKNTEVRLANVSFDRSRNQAKTAALRILATQRLSMTGCEVLTQMPTVAAMFQDISGDCRITANRFVGLVSFYGDTSGIPSPNLLSQLLTFTSKALQLASTPGQLTFCNNNASLLTVGTAVAKTLSKGKASGVFAAAVLYGNTFAEQSNLFVSALMGFDTNAFMAQPKDGSTPYGVMLATRATAAGNVAVVNGDQAILHFVTPGNGGFAKAANEVFIQP
jgi:photosystem II stability/assembly factor-like uncharacterized protein